MRCTLALLLVVAAGCVDGSTEGEPTAPNLLDEDDKSDGMTLWAGLPSITIERYSNDPCNNGQRELGDSVVNYDEWARQRAGVRNVCFEVWSPGITDWNNPDFWQQLDVRVHYRFGDQGEFTSAHVNSIDRRGNNRRYAWSLEWMLDPFATGGTVPSIKVPFRLISESGEWARLEADMQFYFTINGRRLDAPSNNPFVVRYQGGAAVPNFPGDPNGLVLHDIVTCANGVRFGSGAGFFTAEIKDAQAIAELGGNYIYGVSTAVLPQMVQMIYYSQVTIPGQTLPGFGENAAPLEIRPNGSTMKLDLKVYDRATASVRTLSHTFTGCTAN